MAKRQKPDSLNYQYETKAYRIDCSIDTKNEIDKFFVNTKKYQKNITPIIIKGIRYFSIYRYHNDHIYTHMLLVTKDGAKLLDYLSESNDNCDSLLLSVYQYICKYVTDREILSILKKVLPILIKDYDQNKFSISSPYLYETLERRCVCVFYPIFDEDIKGLSAILKDIHLNTDIQMRKCRISE